MKMVEFGTLGALTTKEVQARLFLARSSVQWLGATGRITPVRSGRGSRGNLYDLRSVEAYERDRLRPGPHWISLKEAWAGSGLPENVNERLTVLSYRSCPVRSIKVRKYRWYHRDDIARAIALRKKLRRPGQIPPHLTPWGKGNPERKAA